MSDPESRSGESRLHRWSRLKTQARADQDSAVSPQAPGASAPGPQTPEPVGEAAAEPSLAAEDLPDIETLDKDSDFTPFLAVDVPDELRRLALRKLWASDPVLANLDGLNDYDEDFSAFGIIAETVSSVFKPGEGMPDRQAEQLASETEGSPQPRQEPVEPADGDTAAEIAAARQPTCDDIGADDPVAPEADAVATARDSDGNGADEDSGDEPAA